MGTAAELQILLSMQDNASPKLAALKNQVSETAKGFSGFASHMASTALGVGVAQMAMGALGGTMDMIKGAVFGMNSSLETSTLQFKTLMGSADQATEHVKMLFEFAKATPFETEPIIKASRMLQTFGGTALNTRDNLTLIGDAAAAVSAPIDELGFWVGRAYSMIQSGKPFGEAAMRLQELAVLSPKARAEMERLQESGAKGDAVWKIFTTDLQKFTGAMKEQAGTWKGLTSTFSDTVGILSATAFKPLFEAAQMALGKINDLLGSPSVQAGIERFSQGLAKMLGGATALARELYSAMRQLWPVLQQVAGGIFSTLGSIANSAFRLGADLISQYGAGIVSAASWVIASAMRSVTRLLTFWLKPSSPPLVAPEIDSWGAKTMEQYLRGFGQADFGILSRITKMLHGALDFRAFLGEIPREGVIPMLLGKRDASIEFIRAMQTTGAVTLDMVHSIMFGMGDATEAVGQYLTQLNAVGATERALKQEEEKLAELRKQGYAVNPAVEEAERRLAQLRSALRKTDAKEARQSIEDQINAQSDVIMGLRDADEDRKAALQAVIDKQEGVVEGLRGQVDKGREAVSVEESIVSQYEEVQGLQQQQVGLLKQIADEAKKTGAALQGVGQDIGMGITGAIDEAKDHMQSAFADALVNNPITAMAKTLKDFTSTGDLKKLEEDLAKIIGPEAAAKVQGLKKAWDDMQPALKNLKNAAIDLAENIERIRAASEAAGLTIDKVFSALNPDNWPMFKALKQMNQWLLNLLPESEMSKAARNAIPTPAAPQTRPTPGAEMWPANPLNIPNPAPAPQGPGTTQYGPAFVPPGYDAQGGRTSEQSISSVVNITGDLSFRNRADLDYLVAQTSEKVGRNINRSMRFGPVGA